VVTRGKLVVALTLMCMAAAASAPTLIGGQLATADRVEGPGWWPTKASARRSDFVGASACASCHPAQSAAQPTTAMARTAVRAHDSIVLREHDRLTRKLGAYTYEVVTDEHGSVYTVTDGERRSSAPLAWAFGVGKVGQSFLFERDGAVHEARVSYYDSIGAIDFTPGRRLDTPRDLDEATSRRVSAQEVRRCFGCHTTAAITEGVLDTAALTPGISCEACHGPGRQHVAAIFGDLVEIGIRRRAGRAALRGEEFDHDRTIGGLCGKRREGGGNGKRGRQPAYGVGNRVADP